MPENGDLNGSQDRGEKGILHSDNGISRFSWFWALYHPGRNYYKIIP